MRSDTFRHAPVCLKLQEDVESRMLDRILKIAENERLKYFKQRGMN